MSGRYSEAMVDSSLLRRFLPRFVAISQQRLQRAGELLTSQAPGNDLALAAELHSLAGDASVLGLLDIAEMARKFEAEVRQGERDQADHQGSLRSLAEAIDSLGSPPL